MTRQVASRNRVQIACTSPNQITCDLLISAIVRRIMACNHVAQPKRGPTHVSILAHSRRGEHAPSADRRRSSRTPA
jgi:hypothetical protein